ncbi:MAG: alpha/beta fold hydrolase [Armatimonadota bacterium]
MAYDKRQERSLRFFVRKVKRTMLVVIFLILTGICILAGMLLVCSPGKPKPILDEHGKVLADSIVEKTYISVNGVKQGMFIRSKNIANPVLLFLHGGPAMPEYTFAQKYPAGLEEYFTICYWDQRGAGLSYSPDIPLDTLNAEQIVSDTLEITDYLRNRFDQDKIYLMGHSWGSFIGIQAAARSPERYHAYIGIAQLSQQFTSEQLAYSYMVDQYRKIGDKDMVRKLKKYPLDEMDTMPDAYRSLRDDAMHRLGIGTMCNMKSVVSGIFVPVMLNREYTLGEKINIWRGKWSVSSSNMWNQMLSTDVTIQVPKLEIPAYFFHGSYDYTVSYTLAKSYFMQLRAPMKGFYTFAHSAHSPLFEEPEKMLQILRKDVLKAETTHADTNQTP